MTPIAITFLVLSILLVWGGMIASALFLRAAPQKAEYPPGGDDDPRVGAGPLEHDA